MDTEQLKQTLLSLVEETGKRDMMSGARQASLTLALDGGQEMVVRTTVHDRRRERLIAIIATTGCIIALLLGGVIVFGSVWSDLHGG